MSGRREVERRRLPALAVELGQEVRKADAAWRDAVGHAIRAGELLTEAKALVRHGDWLPWLEANFPGSDRTARNYMRLAANRNRVADLPTVREAVALLAAPKRPEPAGVDDDEALEREVAARLAALSKRTGGPPANAHVAAAQLALVQARLYGERGAHAALTLAGEHLAAGRPELAAAASRVAAAHLADPWDADRTEAVEKYELLRDRGEAS